MESISIFIIENDFHSLYLPNLLFYQPSVLTMGTLTLILQCKQYQIICTLSIEASSPPPSPPPITSITTTHHLHHHHPSPPSPPPITSITTTHHLHHHHPSPPSPPPITSSTTTHHLHHHHPSPPAPPPITSITTNIFNLIFLSENLHSRLTHCSRSPCDGLFEQKKFNTTT